MEALAALRAGAGDVGGGPGDEFLESAFAVSGHRVESTIRGEKQEVRRSAEMSPLQGLG